MAVRLFFFNDTATTEIYTLSLHDALPISAGGRACRRPERPAHHQHRGALAVARILIVEDEARIASFVAKGLRAEVHLATVDRKSTCLNSSHANISYAVFCLKKKQTARARI